MKKQLGGKLEIKKIYNEASQSSTLEESYLWIAWNLLNTRHFANDWTRRVWTDRFGWYKEQLFVETLISYSLTYQQELINLMLVFVL